MAKQDVELQFKLIDGVSKGLASIQQGVNGLGASLVKINAAAELTGKAFGAIGDVAGAFGGAITGAASVEDALTRVNTITQATVEEQKALQDAVRGAVEGTRFSAEEAAGALVLLAEDGFSAKEAVDQLGSVLQFAQANAQSAAQAASGLGAVLDTFGEKPQVIGELADKLTAVAIGAGTSTKALQEGLAGVGNAADQAGLSLDQTIGFLGLLASRGIEGGAAVANFNKIIRELEDPASKAGQALADLGLQGADFGTVLNRLGKDSAAAEVLLSALGRKPREALRVLLAEGGGDLGKFRKILDESGGAAKSSADALNNNFAGALARIQNQLTQTRDDLLTPILAPLAGEFQAFSAQLAEFAQTEQFALIVEQFRTFATSAIQFVGEAVRSFDFTKAVEAVQAFAANTVELFQSVEQSLRTVAGAINETATLIANGYQRLADFAAQVERVWRDFSDGTTTATDVAGDGIKRFGEESDRAGFKIERLGKGLKGTADGADRLAKSTDSAGKSATKAAAALDSVGTAAVKAAPNVDVIITKAGEAAGALDDVPGAANRGSSSLRSFGAASSGAAQSLDSLQRQLSVVRDALSKAIPGSAEFTRLAQEASALEEKIRLAKQAIDDASGAMGNQAEAADKLRIKLQQLRGVQGDVVQGNNDIDESGQSASEALNEIGRKSSAVEISLGNLTEAYVREALAAAGSAKSVRDYIRTLNGFFAAGADVENQIQDRIDSLSKLNVVLSEEDQIRARLISNTATARDWLKNWCRKNLRLAEAKRKGNDEAERGIEIEQRRAAQAGALGTSAAAPAGPFVGATGGRGSAAAPTTTAATVFNVQIDGLTAAGIREVVPEIERELSRLGALRR